MKRFNDTCIVLKSINYKDTDKIYTLYSKNHGKISATANGVRRISSKRGGNLDSLNEVSLSFSEGKGGFYYINEASLVNSFSNIKSSLDTSIKAYYMLELVLRFMEESDVNENVYELLVKAFTLLNSDKVTHDHVTLYFEVSLIIELGFGLNFNSCVMCKKAYTPAWEHCYLNFELGGFVCKTCGNFGIDISPADATFLSNLTQGYFSKTSPNFFELNSLLKHYIKDILADSLKTARVFGHI